MDAERKKKREIDFKALSILNNIIYFQRQKRTTRARKQEHFNVAL